LTACHCTQLTREDRQLFKQYGVRVVHCPESDMKLAFGTAPVPELMQQQIPLGLGTGGCAANGDLDLFIEMDTAAKLHKVMTMDPEVMDAKTVVKMATLGSAQALGLDSDIGSLVPGKRADIIVVDVSRPHLVPMYNPYSHLVYSASGSDVAATIIDGAVVMKDRNFHTLDIQQVINDVKEIRV